MLANIAITFPLIAKRKEYPLNFKLMGVFVSLNDLISELFKIKKYFSKLNILLITFRHFLTPCRLG